MHTEHTLKNQYRICNIHLSFTHLCKAISNYLCIPRYFPSNWAAYSMSANRRWHLIRSTFWYLSSSGLKLSVDCIPSCRMTIWKYSREYYTILNCSINVDKSTVRYSSDLQKVTLMFLLWIFNISCKSESAKSFIAIACNTLWLHSLLRHADVWL